jgi:hypothetical protein
MPCQSVRLGVPQELCGAELQPMLTQLGRDLQYWKPRSITPAMLDEIRAAKRDDPVRVALMIVNRTVWYLRPLGTQRSPMVIAVVHDLQASAPPLRSSAPLHACTPARLPHLCTACTLAPGAQELADSHAVPDVEFVLNVEPPVETWCCPRLLPPPRTPGFRIWAAPRTPEGRLSRPGPSGRMRCLYQPVPTPLISRLSRAVPHAGGRLPLHQPRAKPSTPPQPPPPQADATVAADTASLLPLPNHRPQRHPLPRRFLP